MRILPLAATCLMFVSTMVFAQTEDQRKSNYNIKKGVAIGGYDPVSYFDNKPAEGKPEFAYSFKGVSYRFSTSSNQKRFIATPEKFEPAYGGWCAYAMGENGEKVKIDPETHKILDGRLYLFYNFWGNNTLTDWNKNENILKTKGDQHWKKFIP